MSMLLMVQAMQTKVGNPLRKLVLIKLADNANDKGECWPSFQHIADQCEISRRSVINHVNALIESGLLKKQVRKGPKGNATNIYILSLGGAGDSLGGSATDSPPSAGDSLGGSAGAAPRTSHSSEPVNEPKVMSSKPDSVAQICKRTIDHLNQKTGAKFKHAASHLRLIAARIKDGATEGEIKRVIDRKCDEWLGDKKMKQYLRPGTLFTAGNYDNYVGQLNQPLPNQSNGAMHSGFAQQDYSAGVTEDGYF